MTYEESKKYLECVIGDGSMEFVMQPMKTEVLKNAVCALEKRIPKKVGHRTLRPTEWGSPWYCPECEADLVKVEFMSFDGGEPKNKVSYCWHCGQSIDWGKDE